MTPLEYLLLFKYIAAALMVENNRRRNRTLLKIIRKRQEMRRNMTLRMQRSRKVVNILCSQILSAPHILESFSDVIGQSHRRIWMKPRSYHFWDDIVLNTFDEVDWIENFRMRKETFNDLCTYLQADLEPRSLLLKAREPLSVQKQVAVALYKLASCAEYRVIGNVFGIHKSTVKKCLYRVVNAINKRMMKTFLCMPNEHEALEIAANFETICNIPQIIGCIGGMHIPILAPYEGYNDYVNQRGWSSYNIQAVVDDKCRFRDVCIRHPGNTHNADVFKDSNLYRNVEHIIPQGTKNVNGMQIPYMIVGNPAYPLLPWLLKDYPESVTAEQESFNMYLSSGKVVVEMAFGRLRGRWRILLKKIDIHYEFIPHITSACCILQNFLEYKKEQFMQQWMDDVIQAEILFPQPVLVNNEETDTECGSKIRQHLTEYLSDNFPQHRSII